MNFSNYPEFKKCVGYLIDARFRSTDATLDDQSGVFKIDCWIPSDDVPNRPSPKSGWTKVRWSLQEILSANTTVTDEVAFYEIGSVDYLADSGLVTIRGHYGITIKLHAPIFAGNIAFLNEQKKEWETDVR